MAKNDNPLNFILPAGVAAYVLSPEVRKAVRTAVVKGVAGVMELTEGASGYGDKIKDSFSDIVSEAERMREEAKRPPINVSVTSDEPSTSSFGGEATAAA